MLLKFDLIKARTYGYATLHLHVCENENFDNHRHSHK
jgi:hypothetical protein